MGDTAEALTLNQKVLEYARGKFDQQVGRGECWDLAEEAVTQSGGESSKKLTNASGKAFETADYKWGTEVELKDAQPGDVLQFKGHNFELKTTRSNGWDSEEQNWGHHTAIVEQNLGDGRLVVLEQHTRPPGATEVSKKVQRREIFVKKGTFKEGSAVKTIKTKGVVKAYRPKPKQ